MSKDSDSIDEPAFSELIQKPAIKTYMVVGFLALFLYYLLMMDRTGAMGALLTVLVAIPGLLGWGVISPALFLILNTYLLYDPNFARLMYGVGLYRYAGRSYYDYGYDDYVLRSLYSFDIQDFVLTLAVMAYLMAQYRLLSLMRSGLPYDPAPLRKGQGDPPQLRRPAVHFTDRELGRMLALGGVSVVVGQICWWILTALDVERRFSLTWGFDPQEWGKALLFLWIIGSSLLIASSVFYYIRLNWMSPTEARLIVQDAFWQETSREQERIYRWRRWYGERQAKRAAKPQKLKGG